MPLSSSVLVQTQTELLEIRPWGVGSGVGPCLVGQRRNGATAGVHFTLGDRCGFDQTTVVANFVTSCPRSATRLRFEGKEEARGSNWNETYICIRQIFFFFLDILSRGTLINPLRHSPRNGLNSEQFVSATCILMLISDVREEDLLTLRCFRRVPLPLLIPFQRPPAPLEFHHFDVIIRLAVSISPRPNT